MSISYEWKSAAISSTAEDFSAQLNALLDAGWEIINSTAYSAIWFFLLRRRV